MSSSSSICSSSSLARWKGERKREKIQLPTVLVSYLVTATGNALYYKSLFTVLQCNKTQWMQTGSVPCSLKVCHDAPHQPPPPLPPPPSPLPLPRGYIQKTISFSRQSSEGEGETEDKVQFTYFITVTVKSNLTATVAQVVSRLMIGRLGFESCVYGQDTSPNPYV